MTDIIDPKTGKTFDFAKECSQAATQELLKLVTLVISGALLMSEADIAILRAELAKRNPSRALTEGL